MHFQDSPRSKNAIERDLEEAEKDGDLPRVLILLGLSLEGELTAYIYHAPWQNCFELYRFCWSKIFRVEESLFDIENGRAPEFLSRYPVQSPERELVNRPLFVPKSQAKNFLRARTASEAAVRRAAEDVIREHRKASRLPLIKRDFIDRLVASCLGCTRHRASQAWKDHTPRHWRKGGRRPAGKGPAESSD
jgi:hypothetical protein